MKILCPCTYCELLNALSEECPAMEGSPTKMWEQFKIRGHNSEE